MATRVTAPHRHSLPDNRGQPLRRALIITASCGAACRTRFHHDCLNEGRIHPTLDEINRTAPI